MSESLTKYIWDPLIAAPITEGGDTAQPAIEIVIDPGNASMAVIQKVLEALSDLHIAAGGFGLLFEFKDGQLVGMAEGPQMSPDAPTYVMQA